MNRTMRSALMLLVGTASSGAALTLSSSPRMAVAIQPQRIAATALTSRALAPLMDAKGSGDDKSGGLPFFLDPGTKGGIIFWGTVGIVAPFIAYSYMLDNLGWDVILAGNVILVGYVGLATVAWTASYVFRVANKDMTYAQQLRDYENAVIQKRFEELSEEEVDALMGEIYTPPTGGAAPDSAGGKPPAPPSGA